MFPRIVLLIFVAAVLWAVFARETGAGGRERHYVVRPGDTLWSIVQAHYPGDPRERVWQLQRRNGLRGTTIVPGQRLSLP